jgi:hypothetical protein
MPNKGFIGSEKITSPMLNEPFIADAYLYNGEPTNNLTAPGQLIPNIQTTESRRKAARLSREYPIQRTFVGLSSFGRAIDASPKVRNPTNWAQGQR